MASGTLPASFHLFCVSQMFFCVIQTPQTLIRLSITLFQSSSVQCLCSFAHINLFFLLASLRFSLQLCLAGQHPGVALSLYMLTLAFCGYHLKKLPVEDL